MPVQIRIAELMKGKGIASAYQLAQAIEETGAGVSAASIYRLVAANGRLQTFSAELLDALCDVFKVEPGELLERKRTRREIR
jgi:DNA-binding Xre family transcriptional regulator